MNLDASKPALIGMDWGTSSFRAYLIGNTGEVLDSIFAAEGIMHVPDKDFEGAVARLLGPWVQKYPVPVIASGMITSRNGWIETPYISVPSGTRELAESLVPLRTSSGLDIHFVTGVTTELTGAPDVMRGEETQIIGALNAGMGDGMYVMPGTHSKWVTVENGLIENFATFMTGELFQALRSHTILGTLMADGPFNEQGFFKGVAAGLASGSNLLNTLFHVRTMPLFDKIDHNMVADYLSGILIGTEIRGSTSDGVVAGAITLIGRDDLAERYHMAFQLLGQECRRAPDDIAARGHYSIAYHAGLLS